MPALTINYTVQEVQRMSHAFGVLYNLGRDATQEEVRQATMQWQKRTVFEQERRESLQTAADTVPPPDPFNPT